MTQDFRERRYIDLAGHHSETRKGVSQVVKVKAWYLRTLHSRRDTMLHASIRLEGVLVGEHIRRKFFLPILLGQKFGVAG